MGCQALQQLRDFLGILRDTTAGTDAAGAGTQQVAMPDLSALVAESESTGTAVELTYDGDPCPMDPVVGRTAHRVVQEALANAGKHAPGSHVGICVRYHPDRVSLDIRNTSPTRTGDGVLAALGSRTGLWGLRQRVETVRGSLSAGPTDDGGYRVEATLPTRVPEMEDSNGDR